MATSFHERAVDTKPKSTNKVWAEERRTSSVVGTSCRPGEGREFEAGRSSCTEDGENAELGVGLAEDRWRIDSMTANMRAVDAKQVDTEAGDPDRLQPTAKPLPIVIKFMNISCSVTVKASWNAKSPIKSLRQKQQPDKFLLRGISGAVHPGEMLALMGPSGSGKTTLLNVLGGRGNRRFDGVVSYNDVKFCKQLMRRIGFVTQDDCLYAHLTVRETLTYAALLRLPKRFTKQQKLQRAEDTILELGLRNSQDTIIGGPALRGVSGGERKRVSIGYEMLIDPSVLFLDEPTSGLDSTTSLRIVQTLQELAQAGRTIVITIHQPSTRIFYLLDKILLLAGGCPIYIGPPQIATEYFASLGFSPIVAMNPADFLLDLANGNTLDVTIPPSLKVAGNDSLERSSGSDVVQCLIGLYTTHLASSELSELLTLDTSSIALRAAMSEEREWNSTFWQQFAVLFVRGLKERRHEYLDWLRMLHLFSSALVVGLLWWNSNRDTARELQDQVGLIFFVCVFWGFFPCFPALFAFPTDRLMLIKERNVDMYRLSTYFLSRTLADMPIDCVLAFLYMLLIFLMTDLRLTLGTYALVLLSLFLAIAACQGIGLAIGAVFISNSKKSASIGSIVLLVNMLAGGFYVTNVPRFMQWAKYTSFYYYSYKLLLEIIYSNSQVYDCGSLEGCKTIGTSAPFGNIHLDGGILDVSMLIGMVMWFRLLAYAILRRRTSQ